MNMSKSLWELTAPSVAIVGAAGISGDSTDGSALSDPSAARAPAAIVMTKANQEVESCSDALWG